LVAASLLQTGHASLKWLGVLHEWHGHVARLAPRVANGSATDAEIHEAFHPDARLVRWGIDRLHRHRLAWFKGPAILPRPRTLALPDEAFRVEWVTNTMPPVVRAGSRTQVEVTVKNVGVAAWPDLRSTGDKPPGAVRMGYRWLPETPASEPPYAPVRVNLPAPLPPGQSATLGVEVTAPPTPGAYRIQFDLVQEFITWFESMDATRLIIPVRVLEAERESPRS
jgi:hypothetical protein